MILKFKRGDTRHAVKALLKGVSGNPVNLTDASVRFLMRGRSGAVIDRPAIVKDEENGEVWFVFNTGDTSVSGLYDAEFKVTYLDGKVETFPHDGYVRIQIINDLGGE